MLHNLVYTYITCMHTLLYVTSMLSCGQKSEEQQKFAVIKER